MTAEARAALVRCHFALMEERQLLAGGVLAHNLRAACIAKALLDRKPAPPAPVPAPEVEPPPEVGPPVVVIPQRARPDNLRERLGIS